MSKSEPTIQKYMTVQPFEIGPAETLSKARDLFSKHGIRHLPVVDSGRVVGLLSDRDVKLALGAVGADASRQTAGDVCVTDPYVVEPDDLLSEVARTMASRHYGSAVVVSNGKLVGIFTTVDACRALAEIIETRFHGRN
ncbi:MAG: Hypoxic response protein 1 [Candidatus Omnitrophica bacterium]|nr:Hypoxic response protein 1 [Candidatus Omnitrophota bacterium]